MIFLRSMNHTDVDEVLEWENNPDNWHFSDTKSPYVREDIELLVKTLGEKDADQHRYIICMEKSETRLGAVDLFDINKLESMAGVGVLIAKNEDRGKGIAKRALVLLEEECERLGISNLNASVHVWNEASIRLFRASGYKEVSSNEELIKFEKCLRR